MFITGAGVRGASHHLPVADVDVEVRASKILFGRRCEYAIKNATRGAQPITFSFRRCVVDSVEYSWMT